MRPSAANSSPAIKHEAEIEAAHQGQRLLAYNQMPYQEENYPGGYHRFGYDQFRHGPMIRPLMPTLVSWFEDGDMITVEIP